ncbi:MAG TPA: hypothetical protein VFA47_00120, partial [Candidatus Manganitrophaceae bacterium]|nr:hypothetical protein [Candidatus Manganitrophaceae bacterium]
LGTLAVRGSYYMRTLSFTGIWLPRFRPDEVPLPALPAPLSFGETLPERRYQQGAVKVEQTGLAVDWSLSYFRGYDLFPDIAIAPTPFGATLLLEHHPIRVIGADAATNVGRYGLRAEAAYTLTEDPHGENPEVKNPFFFLVAGGDRTFYEYLNLNVQYILRVVRSYRNPEDLPDPLQRAVAVQQAVLNNQIDRIQQGISMRISDKWWNETLEGELTGIIFFPRHDYAIRPKVTYAFNDRWRGVIGGDLFRGRDDSFFGYLKPNSTLYLELLWSF